MKRGRIKRKGSKGEREGVRGEGREVMESDDRVEMKRGEQKRTEHIHVYTHGSSPLHHTHTVNPHTLPIP